MRMAAGYPKVVEWSAEDRCFVGSCPDLFYGGCHGDDEKNVFSELCRLVEGTMEIYRKEGRALPPPTTISDRSKRKRNIA
jgi:predicted RNase H-like HicB family nuclease